MVDNRRMNIDRITEAMSRALSRSEADKIIRQIYELEIAPYVPVSAHVVFQTYRVGDDFGLKLELGETSDRAMTLIEQFRINPGDDPSAVIDTLRRTARTLVERVHRNLDIGVLRAECERREAEARALKLATDAAEKEAGDAIAGLERELG